MTKQAIPSLSENSASQIEQLVQEYEGPTTECKIASFEDLGLQPPLDIFCQSLGSLWNDIGGSWPGNVSDSSRPWLRGKVCQYTANAAYSISQVSEHSVPHS